MTVTYKLAVSEAVYREEMLARLRVLYKVEDKSNDIRLVKGDRDFMDYTLEFDVADDISSSDLISLGATIAYVYSGVSTRH